MKTFISTIILICAGCASSAQTITLSNGWTVQCTTAIACGQGTMIAEDMEPIPSPSFVVDTNPFNIPSAIDMNIDWSAVNFN